jgi:hypothetical protein
VRDDIALLAVRMGAPVPAGVGPGASAA